MIFINVSPLLWDIIIFGIIIFGIVTGFFIGGRALTFISIGNLLAIGLMLAFKPLLIDSFKNMVSPWFSNLNNSFIPFKGLLTDNVGFLMYAVIWIIGVNILFWVIYSIIHFTVLKKYQVEHKGINYLTGALINFIRMSILGGLIIIMMGTNIFGNKILSYGVIKNEVPTTSVSYKMFNSVDNNIPFLNINVTDINTIITLYQTGEVMKKTITKLAVDTTYDECNNSIKKLNMVVVLRTEENNKIKSALQAMKTSGDVPTNKVIISDVLNEHLINNFLDVNYMVLIFNVYGDIINLYSEVSEVFIDNLSSMPTINTVIPENHDRYLVLKPKINNFISAIKNATAKANIITVFEKIYVPF